MKKLFFICAIFLIAAVSCVIAFVSCRRDTAISTFTIYNLTQKQIIAKMRLVEKGDSHAALALSDYYTFCTDDEESALFWLKKSADLGNSRAKRNLKSEEKRDNPQ